MFNVYIFQLLVVLVSLNLVAWRLRRSSSWVLMLVPFMVALVDLLLLFLLAISIVYHHSGFPFPPVY